MPSNVIALCCAGAVLTLFLFLVLRDVKRGISFEHKPLSQTSAETTGSE